MRIDDLVRYWFYCIKCGRHSSADVISVQATTELQYPSMEGGFSRRGSDQEIIANGWYPWHTPHTWWSGVVKQPESKPDYSTVFDGQAAQGMAHVSCLWHGGLYQQLTTIPYHWYEFSMMGRVWAKSGGKTHARVCINPWGGGPYHYGGVPGKEILPNEFEQWIRCSVTTQALGGKITVYTENLVEFPTDVVVWWDAAQFREVELGDAPPAPPPPSPPVDGCAFVDQSPIILNRLNILELNVLMALRGGTFEVTRK